MATFIIRYLRNLFDVNTTGAVPGDVLGTTDGINWTPQAGGGGGGAPTNADYLVGTANASLTNEIVVGPTPGGELGGTWASPTVPGAVITAPPSSARNVIVPTVGTAIDLIVKAHAAQSVDLTQWQSSAGAVLASINEVGGLLIDNTDSTRFSLEIQTPGLTSDFGEVMQIVNGSGQQIFYMASNGYTEMKFEPSAGAIAWTAIGGPIGMYMDAFQGFAVTDGGGPATYFWWVNPDGYEVIAANTEPADGDIQPGDVFNWYDDTNGAAFFYRKGKTADGTVVKTRASLGAAYTTPYVVGGTDVALADGGTGASTAAGARTNLGLVIGTDVPGQATFDDHSARHESGGADAIKLDDLAAPDDNTDLDVSTTKHGLTPKLSNVATEYLSGTGVFSAPSGSGIPGTIFDAHTILKADTDDTPVALTMGASTILARLAAGNIKAASVAEIITLLQAYTVGGADVAVADGGTGASTAAGARTNLGIVGANENGQAGVLAPTCGGWTFVGSPFTANRCLLARFVPTRDLAVTLMAFFAQVAGAAGNQIDVGIYSADLATRLGSSGSIVPTPSMASVGRKELALTATVNLVAGTVYYATIVPNTTAGQIAGAMINNQGVAGTESLFGSAIGKFETGIKDLASGVLPASIATPTPSSYQGPALVVRES